MKVLFVSSGNNKFGISPIVKAQGESLKSMAIWVEYYTVKGKGIIGYSKNIFRLKKFLQANKYDLIHSHFFLSALVATLSKPRKLVVSLMGSDVYTSQLWNFLIRLFSVRWDSIIVKSSKMKDILGLNNIIVIPNGVELKKFYQIEKQVARKELGWIKTKTYILFASNSNRPEKNYALAKKSLELINNDNIELITLQNIPHDKIVYYLNAADVLLLTSRYEGSSNIIKEAMACNCPIVTTDVGDVKQVIGETNGCYITSFNPENVAHKIKLALQFAEKVGRTKGREKIKELRLDSETIAKSIIEVYNRVLNLD